MEPNIAVVDALASSISAENLAARAAGDSAKRFAKSILTKHENILDCRLACILDKTLFCNII